ncbi:MAG TPA: ABC transporter permease [Vicinamibacterales bacterium]|nr:ABC transporter permease [Vicinamibacterales bacterium]
MNTWRTFLHRLGYLPRKGRFDRQLDEELQFHVESRVDELEQQGYPRPEARLRAVAEFGSRTRVAEESRAAWQFRWLEDVVADGSYALRAFRRRPTFALAAIACLALGIGANALIFSLVNAAFLRPLPYPDADRIAMVRFTPPNQPDEKLGTNSGGYFFIREHNRVFERMGVLRLTGITAAVGDSDDAQREWLQVGWASPGLADVFGVQPVIGRWFRPDDLEVGVVITHGVWQRLFGGRPDVLGQTMRFDAMRGVVIGVTPPGYRTLTPDVDLWIQQTDENLARALRSPNRPFNMFARLRPNATLEDAQADLRTLERPLGKDLPMHQGWGLTIDSLREVYVGYLRQPVLVLQGAVFLLLLIACANVGGLLLSQAVARQKELGVRAALGSSRNRILRQLLTENVLLSCAAGVLGIVLAWIGLRAFVNTGLSAYRDLQNVTLDWTVIGFAIVVSLATALVFGILPALQLSRLDVVEVVRDAGRGATAGRTRSRLRGAFVVAQVALALVLLVATGLLTRSLLRLNAVDTGIDPERLLALEIPMPRALYRNTLANTPAGGLLVEFDSRFSDLTERLRERFASVPGVQSVAATTPPPLGGTPRRVLFRKDSWLALADDREPWSAEWYPVSAGYFETVQIRVLQGRTFTRQDAQSTPPVAIINASLAARYWPNDNPIGRLLQTDVLNDPPREIVGVVGDVRQDRYQSAPVPQVYVPRTQLPYRMDMTMSLEVLVTTFVVRAAGDTVSLVPALRAAVRDVDATLSVSSARTVEDYAADQLQELSQYAAVLGVFGAMSVTLAVIGILGVMAQAVGQRANEIAVRMALGAQSLNVLGLVLRQGLAMIAAGLGVGVVASLMVMPVIRSFLWGVTITDPLTLALVVLALAAVALVACYLPARRALKVAPIAALRGD